MTGRAWVALLSATATASYLCRVNVSVAGAGMMRDLGLSQIELGRVFSAFLLGYALCQAPGGMLADRFGARRVLSIAALAWIAATALIAAVGPAPLAALLVLRFALGVAEAPVFPASAQAISRRIASNFQGRANGFVLAAIGAGSALAPALLGPITAKWHWRAAMLISAIPAVAVAIAWRFASEPPPPPVQTAASTLRGKLLCPAFVLLTISYTLQGYVGYIFVYWFYLYLVQVRGFDFLSGAIFGSLPWLLAIVSIPLGGWLSDRLAARLGPALGRRIVPIAGLAGAGLLLAWGARTPSGIAAAISLALSTAFVLAVEGPFWATMIQVSGEKTGAAGGIMNTGGNLGGLISPALTPVLAARFGWEPALLVAAALSLIAALLWLGIRPAPVSR
jgi:ACS family glucarate transporter-like MFS transporter